MKRLIAVLLLTACGSPSDGGGADMTTARNCTRTCGTCSMGTCQVPGDTADYQAFCGYPCQVTSDCPDPTARCAQLPDLPARVCVTMTNPKLCEDRTFDANFHCPSLGQPTCMNTMVLGKPFGFTQNRVCATEFQFCPAGCNSMVTPNACN